MKGKICVIIGLLLSISIMIVLNNDVNVVATPGGSGGDGEDNTIVLDFDFMWYNITEKLSNVVHKYPIGMIPKGREFGTWGDRYTADYILVPEMNNLGLENVEKEPIHTLPLLYPFWYYNYKVDVIDYKLIINGQGYQSYQYPSTVPLNETYARPTGYRNFLPGPDILKINYNNSFTNLKIVPIDLTKDLTYTIDYLNITYDNITEYNDTIGNATYIPVNDELPIDQEARVFLLDEENGVDEQLENITSNASAVILINDNSIGSYQANISKCNASVITRTQSSDSNLTPIIELLQNDTLIIADNFDSNNTFTFSYNLNCTNWSWCNNDFLYVTPHGEYGYGIEGKFKQIAIRNFFEWKPLSGTGAICRGIIAYDIYDNTHLMWTYRRGWAGWGNTSEQQEEKFKECNPLFQMFLVNRSVGEALENISGDQDASVTGYMKQAETWVDAYNVIGNITIEQSPCDMITVISNRYDGMESEAPGDSSAGAGIVLGIAKYFTDYDIKPKYNLTFLMTTGEEYGYRGAWHYSHTHPENEYNITQWIGTDQLGFNAPGSYLNPVLSDNTTTGDIIWAIANDTRYEERTGYGFSKIWGDRGLDSFVFQLREENCNTIAIHKDATPHWFGHHRTGMNYQEGDSMNYIDRNDLNVTFEFTWNVVKYFCVNPDCWFESYNEAVLDSPDDPDYLNDSINVTFTIKSVLPHDKVMVNATLKNTWGEIVNQTFNNYTVNSTGREESIMLTLPEYEPKGNYTLYLELYNSTGKINESVGIGYINYNYTTPNPVYYYLYPFNFKPEITNITSNPNVTGFGMNITITADVTDVNGINTVKVNIIKPQNETGPASNYTMTKIDVDTYMYVFNDTWIVGQYNYTIWVTNTYNTTNTSSVHSFNISAQGAISVCTVKDEYGNSTFVNVTDPPGDPPLIGYQLMDDGKVLRIWNNYNSYYFNTSSGIQLTNHYNEYWSHNVLMLGYYNNNQWNLIYRTDELSGFNKNIDTDNETYVNATLWKDLTYQGYNFRLAIRYHLGVDDKELTVIPYIKNLGQAIPYNLGFAWEINDIQVDMTPSGDYIEINGTTYYLNQSLDETYKNMTMSCFYIREDISSDRSESLYLCWNDSLDYLVKVKSRDGQYNAPVTLGIKIGTLGAGQEKYTTLLWHDASEITYYFNSYSIGEKWTTNPSYMVDGSTSTYASTTTNGQVELCNGNNCSGLTLGNITKVELRVYGYYTGTQRDITLRPVFDGTTDGGGHYIYITTTTPAWSTWFDITTDPFFTPPWSWTKVDNLDCDVEAESSIGFFTLYCSKVEIRVTYMPNSNPVISNPYPADESTGISIAPMLNITVADPDGNSMNITWLSNSSGSWQVFRTNNSVYNGTYHQTMSNASTNGMWWYWKVNVTDGINYTESNVYKFYTGYESKIKNTGSTNFSGYLLMQVQFFDGYNWVVAVDNCPNETTPRTILVGGQFGLDTVFNGKINTADLIGVFGTGLYRVYACFRDPDGNVLVCNDDSLMEVTYEFIVNL